jgi:hypothetical protein
MKRVCYQCRQSKGYGEKHTCSLPSKGYGDLYKSSAEGGRTVWMWDRIPWEEEGRELDECVEDDETEVEREWRGRKSRGMLLRITCIVRRVGG